MKLKSLFALLLALVLLLSGCVMNKPNANEDSSESDSGADTEEKIEYIDLVKGGEPRFLIVSMGNDFNAAADQLQASLLSKTAVTFNVRRFDPTPEEAGKIYVGVSYSELMNTEESARGIVWKDGNLYICGESGEDAKLCVEELAAAMTTGMTTKDENGKIKCTIPSTILFVKSVAVTIKNALIMGEKLSEFRFVIPKDSKTGVERYLAEKLVADVKTNLGASLEIVTDDAAANAHEIVIGNTARGTNTTAGQLDWSIKKQGDSVYIGLGSMLVLDTVIEKFNALYMDKVEDTDISGKVDEKVYALNKAANDDIRVMTYNSLVLEWDTEQRDGEHRMQLVAETVNLYKPDFVGFQEHKEGSRALIKKYVDSQYEYVNFSGDDSARSEFIPILYNSEEWKIEEKGTGTVHLTAWCFVYARFSRTDNSGEEFILFNLHYCGDPVKYPGYRNEIAAELNAKLKATMAAHPNTPIAVTGDFNDTRYGEAYNKTFEDIPSLKTSYILTKDTNVGVEGTTGKEALPIDNIVVTSELVDVVWQRNLLHAPMRFASDHTPHFADLRVK